MNLRPRVISAVAVLAVAPLLAGCGDDGPERSAPSGVGPVPATVTIERSRFDTPLLGVPVGATVTFVNEDAAAHTVTSVDGSPLAFHSGEMGDGAVFEVTFDRPGTYRYFCEIHPTMRATVTAG